MKSRPGQGLTVISKKIRHKQNDHASRRTQRSPHTRREQHPPPPPPPPPNQTPKHPPSGARRVTPRHTFPHTHFALSFYSSSRCRATVRDVTRTEKDI